MLGHRVELGEVEAAVRQGSGLDGVVALGRPMTESSADGIEVFVETDGFDTRELVNQLKRKLPVYMLPRNVRVLRRFPVNTNGKYDRKALQLILQKKFGADASRAAIPDSSGNIILNSDAVSKSRSSSKLAVIAP